jgi:hypothetical protein
MPPSRSSSSFQASVSAEWASTEMQTVEKVGQVATGGHGSRPLRQAATCQAGGSRPRRVRLHASTAAAVQLCSTARWLWRW